MNSKKSQPLKPQKNEPEELYQDIMGGISEDEALARALAESEKHFWLSNWWNNLIRVHLSDYYFSL